MLPYLRRGRRLGAAKAIWSFVCLLSASSVAAQVAMQTNTLDNLPEHVRKVVDLSLDVLGLIKIHSIKALVYEICSLGLCLLASLVEFCRLSCCGRSDEEAGGVAAGQNVGEQESRRFHHARTSEDWSFVTTMKVDIPISDVITIFSLLGSAFMRASVIGTGYWVGFLTVLQYWSSCQSATNSYFLHRNASPRLLSCWQLTALQVFAAMHMVFQYAWTWGLFHCKEELHHLQPIMELIGLDNVALRTNRQFSSRSIARDVMDVVGAFSVPLLIFMLGFLRGDCVCTQQGEHDSTTAHDVRETLLNDRSSADQTGYFRCWPDDDGLSEWKDAHAAAAVEESRQRQARVERIRSIQSGVGTALQSFMTSETSPNALNFYVFENGGTLSEQNSNDNLLGMQPSSRQFTGSVFTSRDSVAAYVLFSLTWLWDLGLLTMILAMSAWLYALVHPSGPSKRYWNFALVYCELVLTLTYLWQIFADQDTLSINSAIVAAVNILGIHSKLSGCLLLLLAYIVTLYHNHHLRLREMRIFFSGQNFDRDHTSVENRPTSNDEAPATRTLKEKLMSTYVIPSCEFLVSAFTSCERRPSFLLVDVAFANDNVFQGNKSTPSCTQPENSGAAIEALCQRMLNERLGAAAPSLRFHSFANGVVGHAATSLVDATNGDGQRRTILFEVLLPSCQSFHGVRSLSPARDAAKALLQVPTIVVPGMNGEGRILKAEAHSRRALDFYAAGAAFDMLAFVFAAMWFNLISKAAGSLTEITSEHVVPLGYLLTLIVLFLFLVTDRTIYVVGSQTGKACLHVVQVAVWMWYCSLLVWGPTSPATGLPELMLSGPPERLRLLLLVKCASFSLGALQLRSGYPPPASYSDGFGRQTLIFTRSLSPVSAACYRIFVAVPFLYELRALLDWTCTPTTLSLYDYFKLEDISMGLHTAAIIQKSKDQKSKGARQPRHIKVLQGGLLFALLLVLLWAPLLLFTTGAPTYQAPALSSVSLNASLVVVPCDNDTSDESPLPFKSIRSTFFEASDRTAWVQWRGNNKTLPFALASGYSSDQVQLTCSPPDADRMWSITPPAKEALVSGLNQKGSSISLLFNWHFLRDLPPPSGRGGPECSSNVEVSLAQKTMVDIADLLTSMDGENKEIRLASKRIDLRRHEEGGNGTLALYPLFWHVLGDACEVRPLDINELPNGERLPGHRSQFDNSWIKKWVACRISLEGLDGNSASLPSWESWMRWWALQCRIVDEHGIDVDPGIDGRAVCPQNHFAGPQSVVLLERVQGGVLGATLNKFGVLGLYSVVVLSIGRFIRLALSNLRMRIIYEDLPTTKRLSALVRDIYLARAEGLLALEEELFNVLVTVFRLPTLMFQLTKKED